MIFRLGQTRNGDRADRFGPAHDQGKRSSVRCVLIRVEPRIDVEVLSPCAEIRAHIERAVTVAVHDVVLPPDPRVIVGRSSRHCTVEQLLAVAADVDGDRFAAALGRVDQRESERQRGFIAELGELKLLLMLEQVARSCWCSFMVISWSMRPCVSCPSPALPRYV